MLTIELFLNGGVNGRGDVQKAELNGQTEDRGQNNQYCRVYGSGENSLFHQPSEMDRSLGPAWSIHQSTDPFVGVAEYIRR